MLTTKLIRATYCVYDSLQNPSKFLSGGVGDLSDDEGTQTQDTDVDCCKNGAHDPTHDPQGYCGQQDGNMGGDRIGYLQDKIKQD